jgi:CDP-diglyceride synthetase
MSLLNKEMLDPINNGLFITKAIVLVGFASSLLFIGIVGIVIIIHKLLKYKLTGFQRIKQNILTAVVLVLISFYTFGIYIFYNDYYDMTLFVTMFENLVLILLIIYCIYSETNNLKLIYLFWFKFVPIIFGLFRWALLLLRAEILGFKFETIDDYSNAIPKPYKHLFVLLFLVLCGSSIFKDLFFF